MMTMRFDRNTDSKTLCVTNTTVQRRSLPQPQQILVELEARDLVERGERLVEQQKPRFGDERPRDRDAHAHAARKFARIGVLETRQARPPRSCRRCDRAPRSAARPRAATADRHCPTPWPTASASVPERRSRCEPATSFAVARRRVPDDGGVSPAMMRKSVLLPQPEGPSRLTNAPCANRKIDVLERDRAVAEYFADILQRQQRSRRLLGGRSGSHAYFLSSMPTRVIDEAQGVGRAGKSMSLG